MQLIIAEKPKVAQNIARALNANQRHEGYFEGNGYVVTFAYGHMLALWDSVDYDPEMEPWKLEKFPFVPETFKYKVIDDKGVKKQFEIIKKLIHRQDVTEIVHAGDDDREGEIICDLIIKSSGTKKPVKRFLLNEHTPKEVRKEMRNLKDISEMKNRQEAGYSRLLADWLLGINFTSVATLKYGNGTTLKIGRVIMPTVKLVYDRDKEIKNFVPEDYFELHGEFETKNGRYKGIYINEQKNSKFNRREDLENILSKLKQQDTGRVASIERKKTKSYAPQLFNMTDLQGYITSKYNGWDSEQVLKTAQKLYESGYITYPRTSSRRLEETPEQIERAKEVLEIVSRNFPYKHKIKFKKTKNVFDSSKVDSHPAIIPTYIIPESLGEREEIVYNEIVKRFVAQFMPPAEYENIKVITMVGEYSFLTKGKILLSQGWLEVYGGKKDDDDNLCPDVKENESVDLLGFEILAKQTQPPKHYTEETLLKAMQNCGRNVEDIENILKGYSIGTDATRAETLKKIQEVGYVKKKGKTFYITPMGERLVEVFPVKQLMDTDYTGRLEKKLKDIEKGEYTRREFLKEIINLIENGVEKIKNSNSTISFASSEKEVIGKCPECGGDVIEYRKGFCCANYKDGCKFALWKDDKFLQRFKKRMTKTLAKKLLKSGKAKIENMVSPKTGGKFNCELELVKKENGYWGFEMHLDNTKGTGEKIGKCPDCGNVVVETAKAFSCSSDDCNFALWKNDKFLSKFKKKMTKSLAKELLRSGRAGVKKMYSQKKGKFFDATLVLKKNGQYWGLEFDFD
ncbi:MAG: type IA DNA topoisomerase [Thermosipho sp. (in: Bacteria)]|nr:type IA DNA topoisomerase [Thermosipho sp. (in: thermotogales)]